MQDIEITNITRHFPIGSPCKMTRGSTKVLGRYIGNSSKGSSMGDVHSIIIFSTPHGTLVETGRCHVLFDLTPEDLVKLKEYEDDAKGENEWYHKRHYEDNEWMKKLDALGCFINYEDIKPVVI